MGRPCAICGGRNCLKTLWRASWRSPSYSSAIIRRSPTCVELDAFPRSRNASQEEKVKRGLSSPYKGHGPEQSHVVQQQAVSLAVPSNPTGLLAGTESHASLQQRNQWHQLQGQQQGQQQQQQQQRQQGHQQERQQGHQQERQQGQQQGQQWEEQQQPAVGTAPSSLAVPAFLHHPPAQRPRLSVLQAAMALAAGSHNQQAEATLAAGGDIPGQRAVLPQLLGGLLTRLTAIPGFRELAAGLQQLSGSLSDALPRSSPVLADAGRSHPPGGPALSPTAQLAACLATALGLVLVVGSGGQPQPLQLVWPRLAQADGGGGGGGEGGGGEEQGAKGTGKAGGGDSGQSRQGQVEVLSASRSTHSGSPSVSSPAQPLAYAWVGVEERLQLLDRDWGVAEQRLASEVAAAPRTATGESVVLDAQWEPSHSPSPGLSPSPRPSPSPGLSFPHASFSPDPSPRPHTRPTPRPTASPAPPSPPLSSQTPTASPRTPPGPLAPASWLPGTAPHSQHPPTTSQTLPLSPPPRSQLSPTPLPRRRPSASTGAAQQHKQAPGQPVRSSSQGRSSGSPSPSGVGPGAPHAPPGPPMRHLDWSGATPGVQGGTPAEGRAHVQHGLQQQQQQQQQGWFQGVWGQMVGASAPSNIASSTGGSSRGSSSSSSSSTVHSDDRSNKSSSSSGSSSRLPGVSGYSEFSLKTSSSSSSGSGSSSGSSPPKPQAPTLDLPPARSAAPVSPPELKARLLLAAQALGPVAALMPGTGRSQLVQAELHGLLLQLEAQAPQPAPWVTPPVMGSAGQLGSSGSGAGRGVRQPGSQGVVAPGPPYAPAGSPQAGGVGEASPDSLLCGQWRLEYAATWREPGGAPGHSLGGQGSVRAAEGQGSSQAAKGLQGKGLQDGQGFHDPPAPWQQNPALDAPSSSSSSSSDSVSSGGFGRDGGEVHGKASPPLPWLLHALLSLPGWGLDGVVQRLQADHLDPGRLQVANSCVFSLGPLGRWRFTASGVWRPEAVDAAGLTMTGWFDTLTLSPLSLPLGEGGSTLDISLPVPTALQVQSPWRTTYLDADTRITHAAGGIVFLFRRLC